MFLLILSLIGLFFCIRAIKKRSDSSTSRPVNKHTAHTSGFAAGTGGQNPPSPNSASTAMFIYNVTPKMNCGKCGVQSCMAFARMAASRQMPAEACPYLDKEKREAINAQLGQTAPQQEQPLRCPNCGETLQAGDIYCQSCGSPVRR